MNESPVPVLETERLRLRPLAEGDVHAVFTLLSDERVVRYMLFPLFTPERARAFVERVRRPHAPGHPPELVLGIARRADDRTIGLCGLVMKAEMQEGEAWYLLDPAQWGRGLATEAVRAMVDHGFRALALHRTWASCLPENPASACVLEKLGFRQEGLLRQNLRIQGEWRDSYLYATLAAEWTARAKRAAAT